MALQHTLYLRGDPRIYTRTALFPVICATDDVGYRIVNPEAITELPSWCHPIGTMPQIDEGFI